MSNFITTTINQTNYEKNTFLLIIYLITHYNSNAQILFNESFDNYSSGHLNPDYTGSTIGQGGWFFEIAGGLTTTNMTAMVTPETGRGNVLSLTTNGSTTGEGLNLHKKGIDILWNNRTVGNNVIKLEYEIYGEEYFAF